jgi:hypothetical protein
MILVAFSSAGVTVIVLGPPGQSLEFFLFLVDIVSVFSDMHIGCSVKYS